MRLFTRNFRDINDWHGVDGVVANLRREGVSDIGILTFAWMHRADAGADAMALRDVPGFIDTMRISHVRGTVGMILSELGEPIDQCGPSLIKYASQLERIQKESAVVSQIETNIDVVEILGTAIVVPITLLIAAVIPILVLIMAPLRAISVTCLVGFVVLPHFFNAAFDPASDAWGRLVGGIGLACWSAMYVGFLVQLWSHL